MAEDSAETGAELFGGGDDFQGTERRQALLDEYKLFVGTMENAVARRQRVNSFYLTGHSILVGAIGVMIQQALKVAVAQLQGREGSEVNVDRR